jgi:hypothetical protein
MSPGNNGWVNPGGKLTWKEVSSSRPCPKCSHASWCSVDEGSDWCCCRRYNDGTAKEKTDTAGNPFYLYRLTPRPAVERWAEPRYSLADGKGERADPDILNKVYYRYLGQLQLSAQHVKDLNARGLKDGLLAAGYRTLGQGRRKAAYGLVQGGLEELLPRVPGFFVQEREGGGSRCWSVSGAGGLLIPIRNTQGQIVALITRADSDTPGGKYRFVSSKKRGGPGPGSPVHVSLFKGDRTTVRVTEGVLKADVATRLSGILTIGLPGVGSWRKAARVLQELGAKVVRVAFDADRCTNHVVGESHLHLVRHLQARGLTVELEVWDHADGKGIDDLLVAGKVPEVLTGEVVLSAAEAIADQARKADPPPSCPTAGAGGFATSRMIVVNNRQLCSVTAEALAAIRLDNNPPKLFQRGGLFTRLKVDPSSGAPSLQAMDEYATRGHMARVATWVQATEDRIINVSPPMDVVRDVRSLPEWADIPPLDALVETPVFGRGTAP